MPGIFKNTKSRPVRDTRTGAVYRSRMEKVLIALGFQAVRQKGSHVFYRHPDGRTTTLPNHPQRNLARPSMREILREVRLTQDQFKQEFEGA